MYSFSLCLLVVISLVVLSDSRSHHHRQHHRNHRRTGLDTDVAGTSDVPSLEKRDELCVYENVTYSAGEKFRPDDCTFCRCPRRGGKPACSVMDCKHDRACLWYEKQPGECCDKCVELGCLHTDGKVYPKGSEVLSDPCTKCFCPKDSQRTVCMKSECPLAMCVDLVKLPHQCCGYCPRGPTCRYNGRVISAKAAIRVDKCTVCHCPTPIKDPSLVAVCTNLCDITRKELEKRYKGKKGQET